MAVSANALTLMQYAIMSNDPLVQQVTYSLLQNAQILQDLPILTKKTLLVNDVRWEGSLPSVNWSMVNVDPVVTSGTPTARQEQAYIIRNAIDVDRFLVEDENRIQDPRAVQANAYLKAVGYDFNDKFFNNDHLTGNANAPVGMRYRLDNQTTWGVNTDMKVDFSTDLSGTITAANANKFIENVQSLLDYLGAPDGTGVVFYTNDVLRRKWETAIRTLGAGGGFGMTKDAFDRDVATYRNAKIRDIGRKADQSTRIITATEANTGAAGSSTYTSLYAIRYGEDGLMGWQFDALAPKDIQLIGNGGSTYRLLIDWAVGLWAAHTRCIARGYDIKVA